MSADLLTFSKKILKGKHHFLHSVWKTKENLSGIVL